MIEPRGQYLDYDLISVRFKLELLFLNRCIAILDKLTVFQCASLFLSEDEGFCYAGNLSRHCEDTSIGYRNERDQPSLYIRMVVSLLWSLLLSYIAVFGWRKHRPKASR